MAEVQKRKREKSDTIQKKATTSTLPHLALHDAKKVIRG